MAIIPAIIGLASLALGAYQTIKSNKDKKKAEEEMNKAMAQRRGYKESDASKKMLADAESQLNATSPAVTQAYDQAQKAAAGARAQAQRNATSGADALAMGSISQTQLQNMLPAISAQQESAKQANRVAYYNALSNAQQQEELKAADNQARYSDLINLALGKMGGAQAGMQSGATMAASGLSGIAGAYNSQMNTGQTAPVTIQTDATAPTTLAAPPAISGQSPATNYGLVYDFATGQWVDPQTLKMRGRW